MNASPEARRVLIATIGLTGRGGTDVYTRDLALALLRRGLLPIIYTHVDGILGDELRRATIPVVTRLDAVGATPDIIHGHHHIETLAALARFPGVPALYVCHDARTWHSLAPLSARIRHYVAVDRNCRDRMMFEQGIDESAIRLLTNPVDLDRMAARDPLPPKPKRALIFSNAASAYNWAAAIREACEQRGLTVDTLGVGAHTWTEAPEAVLPRYDVVFGKARCALEAMAAGAAVIVCDARGLSGMVTSEDVAALRELNFGARTLQRPITRDNILRELDRYDTADAARVTRFIRESAGVDLLAEELIALYEEVIASATPVNSEDDLRAISASLERLMTALYARAEAPAARFMPLRRLVPQSRALTFAARVVYQLRRSWKR